MFLKTGKKVYWKKDWTDPNEPWHVGNLLNVNCKYQENYCVQNGGELNVRYVLSDDMVLVRHSRTGNETEDVLLEFVEWSKLYNYYGDKTPPEFTKEHASVPYKSDEQLKEIGKAVERRKQSAGTY